MPGNQLAMLIANEIGRRTSTLKMGEDVEEMGYIEQRRAQWMGGARTMEGGG